MTRRTGTSVSTPWAAYLLIALPWLLDSLEKGRPPQTFVEIWPEIVLSGLIAAGVHALVRSRRLLSAQRAEMDRLAELDTVSSLGSPRALEATLVKEVARARRMDHPLSCIFMDLDDFNAINTRFGHTVGNSVLQVIGRTVRTVIRGDVDSAFRYGGDEFFIILPAADKEQARVVARRLSESILALKPPTVPLKTIPVSLGIAQLRPQQVAGDLLALMDKSMRRAKGRGKNLVFDAEAIEDKKESGLGRDVP